MVANPREDPSSTVVFEQRCAEEGELLLKIRAASAARGRLLQMWPVGGTVWRIEVPVSEGHYYYRFYRRSGESLIYHAPQRGEGFDAELFVRKHHAEDAIPIARRLAARHESPSVVR